MRIKNKILEKKEPDKSYYPEYQRKSVWNHFVFEIINRHYQKHGEHNCIESIGDRKGENIQKEKILELQKEPRKYNTRQYFNYGILDGYF